MSLRDDRPVWFYELHEGDEDVFTDLLGVEMIPVVEGLEVARHRPYFIHLSPDGRAAWEATARENVARELRG